MRTGCTSQVEAMRNFQNVVDFLPLSEDQAEQLRLIMLGEVNRVEQVGNKYWYDQKTGQEIIAIPCEWLKTNIASTKFEQESLRSFDKEVCRGKENVVCKRVEHCKNIDTQK